MKAVIFREHSPDLDVYDVVDDMPTPEIGPDEVLIKVHYSALNRLDDWVRRGWPGLNLALPHIPGSDFAGEIAAVGEQVSGWEIGQQVTGNPTLFCGQCRYCLQGNQHLCEQFSIVGEHAPGACAEYMKLPARNLIAIPEGVDLKRVAAGNLVGVTAWRNIIVDGGLRPNETMLVVGAGGGVNMTAIQLGKLVGATVWVVASTAEKAQKALDLGADWAIDRSQEPNWAKAVWKKRHRQGVDVVVDNVGQATWSSSLRALGKHGRLLTVGGTTGYRAEAPVNLIFMRQQRIIGSTMGNMEDARNAFELIFSDKITPVIDSVWPLEGYVDAMKKMLAGEHFGKLVIDVLHSV